MITATITGTKINGKAFGYVAEIPTPFDPVRYLREHPHHYEVFVCLHGADEDGSDIHLPPLNRDQVKPEYL